MELNPNEKEKIVDQAAGGVKDGKVPVVEFPNEIVERKSLDALSTTATKGSDDDEEEEEQARQAAQKRTSSEDRKSTKKGKPEAEERTGNELFLRGLTDEIKETEIQKFFKNHDLDAKTVEFLPKRKMCFVLLSNEIKESQVKKIGGRLLGGMPFSIELLEQTVNKAVPEVGKDTVSEVGKDTKEEEKAKNDDKDQISKDQTKVTDKSVEVNRSTTVNRFTDKVQEYLAKILDIIQMLERHEDLSYDLGLSISRGYILIGNNEKSDFGKAIEEYLRKCNILVKARDTKKLDSDGVDNLFQEVITAHTPGVVLLKNIEEAALDVSTAIVRNVNNVAVSHLPIVTVGTTTIPDQIDNGIAMCFSVRP